MTLVAGVDSSTQSCKIVVRECESGAVVRTGRAPHPEGTSVPAEAWWVAFLAAVADAGGLEDVAAISIAGQQHGLVALDATGTPVRDALLWNDIRSAPAANDLIRELGADRWARFAGSVPVASYTVSKLRWLRDHEPDRVGAVAGIALPHDYLTWRLRGYGVADPDLGALTTDRSDASGTGYWSPRENRYQDDLVQHALGSVPLMPAVLGPGDRAGMTGSGIPGIPADVVVGVGAGDNAAAAFGLGAVAGDVIVSIGTSGTVFAVTDRPVEDPTGVVSGFADASGRYLPLIATFNAARVLDAAGRLLGVHYDGLSDLALSAEPGSGGLVLLPYLEGERTPNLPDATGSLMGMSLTTTTRPNLARAMIEGMLCGLADGLDVITAQGVDVHRVLLIGGGARNTAVQKIASQIFGLEVTVPPQSEYVADGAARQAAWALIGHPPDWSIQAGLSWSEQPHPEVRSAYHRAQVDLGYR